MEGKERYLKARFMKCDEGEAKSCVVMDEKKDMVEEEEEKEEVKEEVKEPLEALVIVKEDREGEKKVGRIEIYK